jgi:hypothetical protein
VESVLVDDREDGRYLGDLVPQRLGIITVESMAALPAVRRPALDHLTELFRRDQFADLAAVTRLTAALPAGGRDRGRSLD